MISLVKYLASSLVDEPDSINVLERTEDGVHVLELSVAEGDMGKIIGKHGRTARAIRAVVSGAAQRRPDTYDVEIVEREKDPEG